MNKLVVCDYSSNIVDIYDINSNTVISDEYIESLGYRIKDVSWISGNLEINFKRDWLV